MRLTTVVMFGAGYVMGTKAGRERYEQIVMVAENASKRLDQFSARTPGGRSERRCLARADQGASRRLRVR